jgi:cell division protein ZapA (FtsZ GTPase activity inhibitor)
MTILKLKIDNIGYEIECKKGEENLLRKAEELLNSSLDNNPHLKTLSQSKKFLMLSLVLAADLSFSKKQFKDEEEDFKKILNELSELQKIIGIKSD